MRNSRERGMALVLVLMSMTLVMTIGAALILLSSSETLIAANFRASNEAFHAADMALERALVDLNSTLDWNPVISGAARSAFIDSLPIGPRTLADGSTINLVHIVNLANCRKTAACTPTDLRAVTADRPWGANNPQWMLYSYGPLASMSAPSAIRSPFFVITLVADDSSENDGDPLRDGDVIAGVPNPGLGTIAVRAESFGPRNAHRAIEATIARIDTTGAIPGVRFWSWREFR